MLWRAALATIFVIGCKEAPSSANAPVASASETASTMTPNTNGNATIAFCAYGGVGVLGPDASPDDFYRVIAWVVVHAPAPATDVAVKSVDVVGGDAGAQSHLRKIESVERLAATAKLTPPDAWTIRGTSFDGTLAPGDTKLRVEAWITRRPRNRPFELRIAFDGPTFHADATCPLGIEWPTG